MRLRTTIPRTNGFKFSMSSCESLQSSAYSNDLHWRIVWQCFALMMHIKEVAKYLIDQFTEFVKIFKESSTVHKKEYSKDNAFENCMNQYNLHLVFQRLGIYLREIQAGLQS